VDKSSSVRLNVSRGPTEPAQPAPVAVAVPNVIGQSRHSAEQAIEDAGLRPSTQHVPSNEAKDTVVSQSPSGGSTPSRARACC
jgi:beta-lactam-binding protein with PASTA domain